MELGSVSSRRAVPWISGLKGRSGRTWQSYDNCSFSIYKNNDAIATAGKTSPTSGTRIDGRFKLIIYFTFSKI